MPDLGEPSSYLVLAEGTLVYASGGEEVGKVEHVLADPSLDVFDGIVVEDRRVHDGHLFVDASQVDEVYENGVMLKLDLAATEQLPAPTANPEEIDVGPDDVVPDNFHDKLRKAWNRVSGNY